MRVAMLMGDTPWVESWARAAETQCEVIRIRFRARASGGPWLARSEQDPREYSIRLPRRAGPYRLIGRLSDLPLAMRFARALHQIEQDHGRVDAVHAHFYSNARWLPEFQRFLRRPYIVTEHSSGWGGENPDNQLTDRGVKIARRTYRYAALVIPVSDNLRRLMVDRGVTANMLVIPNPVDTELFHAPEVPPNNAPPRLIAVSRLARVKNYPVLFEAVRKLADSGLEVHLEVVGDGPLRFELEELIEQSGNHAISLLGARSQSEVASVLRDVDLFVTATRYENLPVSVIEAVVSGLRVVGTDLKGIREVVDTDAMGILVPAMTLARWPKRSPRPFRTSQTMTGRSARAAPPRASRSQPLVSSSPTLTQRRFERRSGDLASLTHTSISTRRTFKSSLSSGRESPGSTQLPECTAARARRCRPRSIRDLPTQPLKGNESP